MKENKKSSKIAPDSGAQNAQAQATAAPNSENLARPDGGLPAAPCSARFSPPQQENSVYEKNMTTQEKTASAWDFDTSNLQENVVWHGSTKERSWVLAHGDLNDRPGSYGAWKWEDGTIRIKTDSSDWEGLHKAIRELGMIGKSFTGTVVFQEDGIHLYRI